MDLPRQPTAVTITFESRDQQDARALAQELLPNLRRRFDVVDAHLTAVNPTIRCYPRAVND